MAHNGKHKSDSDDYLNRSVTLCSQCFNEFKKLYRCAQCGKLICDKCESKKVVQMNPYHCIKFYCKNCSNDLSFDDTQDH